MHTLTKTLLMGLPMALAGGALLAASHVSETVDDDSSSIYVPGPGGYSSVGDGYAIEAKITSASSVGDIYIGYSREGAPDPLTAANVGDAFIFVENSGSGGNYVDNASTFSYFMGTESWSSVIMKGRGVQSFTNTGGISGTQKSTVDIQGGSLFVMNNSGNLGLLFSLESSATLNVDAAAVDITNTGFIHASGQGGAVFLSSSVGGGTLRNSSKIYSDKDAVNVAGGGVRVELLAGSDIRGNVTLAANAGNSLFAGAALEADRIQIAGAVSAANSGVVIQITSADKYGFLNASGEIDISGSTLDFDFFEESLAVGDVFTVLNSDESITGNFANYSDGDKFWAGDGGKYNFQIHIGSNQVVLELIGLVPEPSAWAAVLGAAVLAFAFCRRKILAG